MIEASIDEAISDMDESIKKLVISKVRSALIGDISSKNNVVNKIISYLNDSFDIELYISEKDADLNVARLVIHKNGVGNMIDVKLNYVHELQQAFRMCNLQYVADNFKI